MAGRRIDVTGQVQGVGFRPAVYRLAEQHRLFGWVANTSQGACIEVTGPEHALDRFAQKLRALPAPVCIEGFTETPTPAKAGAETGPPNFEIRRSIKAGGASYDLRPDATLCARCRSEMNDPANRRHRYPFISCPACGPTASVATALPWDRAGTTMAAFAPCASCQSEYLDPTDVRFHGQLVSCPACGPQLFWGEHHAERRGEAALLAAVAALDAGAIIAVKGLGGYQLMSRADDGPRLRTLRRMKGRPRKPFAVMVPDLDGARRWVRLDDDEEQVLASPQNPIVIARGKDAAWPEELAPDLLDLGVMLPASGLHALLCAGVGVPLVVTSANRSGEPIALVRDEVLRRFGRELDVLDHNRPIARRLDDSVVKVIKKRPMLLRRARGYAPAVVARTGDGAARAAVGAQLKCAVAVAAHGQIIAGAHVGDLQGAETRDAARDALADLCALTGVSPAVVAADAHPDGAAARLAQEVSPHWSPVLHHQAHVAACLVEHDFAGQATGLVWDGLGFGGEDVMWGGEVFDVSWGAAERRIEHVSSVMDLVLIGGERALMSPLRQALGACWASGTEPPVALVKRLGPAQTERLWRWAPRSPRIHSVGRWFDVVAGLLGLCDEVSDEGEAARLVEQCARGAGDVPPFALEVNGGRWGWDVEQMVLCCTEEPVAVAAARFQATLAALADNAAQGLGHEVVAVSGGCFANRGLLESVIATLEQSGHRVLWPRRLPCGDGGVATGQLALLDGAARRGHVSGGTG